MTRELKQIDRAEARALLTRIIDGATAADAPLSEVLRLCMRLGALLKNNDLSKWSRLEATGYEKENDVPSYRKLPTEVRGTFLGPFQSRIDNVVIPKTVIDKEHRNALFNAVIFSSVGEVERIANSGSDNDELSSHWSGDTIAYYQTKELYSNGFALASAWRMLSRAIFVGILDAIRTRVLDFALQIKDEMELDDDSPESKVNLPAPARIEQIFNTTITGGTVAFSGSGEVTQTNISIGKGDLSALKAFLLKQGIKSEDLADLEAALSADGEHRRTLGSSVKQWLADMSIKLASGVYDMGVNITSSLLVRALMAYFGMDS